MSSQRTLLEMVGCANENRKKHEPHTAKSYTGIYRMHKYWSKKPYNIINHLIKKYSEDGDIVVDPFCGSGISVIESVFLDRKAIGIDINPSAVFITSQMIKKVTSNKLKNEFLRIEKDIRAKINSFYIVRRGTSSYVGTHFIWENDKLVEAWYKDGRKKIITLPSEDDIELAESFSYDNIQSFYPKAALFKNARINAKKNQKVYELFTPRNLLALSTIYNRIEEVDDKDIQDTLKFCFTACMGQASRMVFVIDRRGKYNGSEQKTKKEVGSWVIGYWIPSTNFEINVWNCFKNRFKRIYKAKEEQEKMDYSLNITDSFKGLTEHKNLLLINKPAQLALKDIPDSSIDYIITDPPHGDRQPYLELSMMWNSWLKKDVNYNDEIVISDSKDRNKDLNDYFSGLNLVFSEIERILRPGHFFTLMFNSLDDNTWFDIINSLNKKHFELIDIETMSYSANSVVQDTRKAGLKTDFILTFKKNTERIQKEIEIISISEKKNEIVNLIENYTFNKGVNGLETFQIINLVVKEFLHKNQFFKLSEVITFLKNEYVIHNNRWIRGGMEHRSES